ncbi:hypothetical protein [Luteibacter jiangsuensis]
MRTLFFSALVTLAAYPAMVWLVTDPPFGRMLTELCGCLSSTAATRG